MVPDVSHMRCFGTICYPVVDKDERAKHEQTKDLRQPAVKGIFLGYHDIWNNTYKVITNEREGTLIHSRHVLFNLESPEHSPLHDDVPAHPPPPDVMVELDLPPVVLEEASESVAPSVEPEEASVDVPVSPDSPVSPFQWLSPDEIQQQNNPAADPEPRYPSRARNPPVDIYEEHMPQANVIANMLLELEELRDSNRAMLAKLDEKMTILEHEDMLLDGKVEMNYIAQANLAHAEAMMATKDMSWKTLVKLYPEEAPKALAKELASLEEKILTRLKPGDEEYETALAEACPGRLLGTIKRKREVKARGVKQGFKENIAYTDGPDFNYYSHVAKMISIRASLMRRDRRNRRIAIKDISTAFLQSHKYPPDAPKKYIKFVHPLTGETMFYRQLGPIYGENSAPKRWEDTLFEWLTDNDPEETE